MPVTAVLPRPSHQAGSVLRFEPAPSLRAPHGQKTPAAPASQQSEPDVLRYAPRSDEELLARYRDQRRPEDFVELVRRYSGDLGRHLARYLGDPVLAEDVLQDTFLLVHSKCGLYRDGRPAKPWLYTIAIHRAIDAMRRAKRMPTARLEALCGGDEDAEPGPLLDILASAEPGPLEQLQEQERQLWVRDSVAKLPEILRQVLVLAYDRELSYAEIADLLGVPLGTVKSRLHRAICELRWLAQRHDRMGSR